MKSMMMFMVSLENSSRWLNDLNRFSGVDKGADKTGHGKARIGHDPDTEQYHALRDNDI